MLSALPDGVVDTALYAVGAAVLVWAIRWWRPEISRRWAVGYALLTFLLFSVPLATERVQVPVDMLYQWLPWYGTVEERVEPQNTLLADIPLQMIPYRSLVRERLLDGEAPLWAHELGTGQPLLGNGQSAPFAPLHLMALPVPTLRALTLAAAWQILVALLLTHALALALTGAGGRAGPDGERDPVGARRHVGAALAAVAFALSVFSMVWLYHPLSMVTMFLPGVILGIVALARGTPRALPGLVACAVAMAVSGHPETVAHTAAAAAVLGLVLWLRRPAVGRMRFAVRAAVAALLAFALAAPAILPILEALPESERMIAIRRGAGTGVRPPPFTPEALLPMVQPLAYGSPRQGDWNGPRNFNEVCSHYAGLLTLSLALGGAVAFRGRILAVVAAGGLALAVALNVGPIYEAFDAIPVLNAAAHARMRLFWVLAAALAAGMTLGRFTGVRSRSEDDPRPAQWWTATAVVLGVVLFAAFHPPASAPAAAGWTLRETWWVVALAGGVLGGAALAVLSVAAGRGARSGGAPDGSDRGTGSGAPGSRVAWSAWVVPVAWILPAAVLLDLALLGARYHPLVPPEHQLETPPAIAWLQERFEESAEPFRVIGEGASLIPNVAAYYGLWDPRGNDPMRPGRPFSLLAPVLSDGRWRRGEMVLLREPWNVPALEMLGVRYVLTHRGKVPRGPWTVAYDGPDGRILELPTALSLFWVPERVRPVDQPEKARHLAARIGDPARLVAYHDPTSDRTGFQPAVGQEGEVWIRRVEANGFDLVTRSRDGMLVASSVSDAPDWHLEIDGEPADTIPVSWAFVGFRAPPGVHRVRLRYRPMGWDFRIRN